ncbi:MAG: TIGR03915 family putative DNA repair protein [Firmicutes bacterium]|nr:TIGR03915 family putative DNA repair protein [Bacillota bacterium]
MLDRPELIYLYDGTFAGLLCCVFESYAQKEIPADILPLDSARTTLWPGKEIVTDQPKADRVLVSIPPQMGHEALDFLRHAFLTCLPQKERYMLLFLRLGYRHGPRVMHMLASDVVHTLDKSVRHLRRESHLLKGFLRFSVFNQVLVGEIEPKNHVLPLLADHFRRRYPEEYFLIFDRTHGEALVYRPYQSAIIALDEFVLPEPDERELFFRDLWRHFYDAIEITDRHNPRCRMSQMPKRYWTYMTEFDRSPKRLGENKLNIERQKLK